MMLKTLSVYVLLFLQKGVLVTGQSDNFESDDFHPTRYIVEFSDVGSAKFRKRDGSRDTDDFITALKDAGSDVEPAFSFTSDLFHGASFDLADGTEDDIAAIHSLPEVKNIWPAAYITLGVEPQAIFDQLTDVSAWDPHKVTNVSRVHEAGTLGDGVIVAIVDSGIDYTHPALGGGFGPGFKVESGYDFTTGSSDPIDCFGHGTHVAGIIGADDEFLKGVAPAARLRAYKVVGCQDGTTEDMAISAFLRAYEEGADVINGSLGANRPFPNNPISIVLSRIQEQGVLIVVAAGNSGVSGPFYTTNLGNNHGGFTVGSIEHESLAGYEVTAQSTSGDSRTFVYVSSDAQPFNRTGEVPASWVSESTRDFNACYIQSNIPTIPDDNLIVLPLDNRLNNKVDWVFWYNFEDDEYEVPTRRMYDPSVQPVGSALISYDDGDWLVSQHENGHEISFIFNTTAAARAADRPSLAGGRLNVFSSWGPTLDARIKPEVVAPGGSIFNTYLNGGWALLSGTSMASPYIAGVAALVLEAHGTRSERDDAAAYARSRIINSARSIKHANEPDAQASVGQQGAGIVDAIKAVQYATSVEPAYINLNDTDHFEGTHAIQVTNHGNEPVSYQITHSRAPTYFTRNLDTRTIDSNPLHSSADEDVAEVTFSAAEIVVGPGDTVSFDVTFTEPASGDTARYPVYGGSVVISGNNEESVRVVYMGIKGSLYNFPQWGGDVRPFLNEEGEALTDGGNYSFIPDTGVPYAPFEMTWSTLEFSFDFVDRYWTPANWTWPQVAGENNFNGHFRTTGNGVDFVVADFPVRNFTRLRTQFYARPSATFSDGRELADGEYRYLRRSLRTFGDPNKIDDWLWDLSPWFSVQRA